MGRKIVITSGKGGVGKTTITTNLGIALALENKKVILVDADIGLNNLDLAMNIENEICYDLKDLLKNKCTIKQALVEDKFLPNLSVLPSSKMITEEELTAKCFSNIINELAKISDFVLIDCPAGIEYGFNRAVTSANESIVVTTPHITAIRDADKILNLLATYEIKQLGLIVNRLRNDMVAKGDMLSAEDISRLLRTNLKGVIYESDQISINTQIERDGNKQIGRIFKEIALNIINNGNFVEKKTGFLKNLFKRKII